MSHDLFCGTTYNGTAARIYCAVERDDCAATKLLNNESRVLYGFAVHFNLDRSSGTMSVLCGKL